MNRRLVRSVWPLLAVFVLGSLVLPAAHRACHHAAQGNAQRTTKDGAAPTTNDNACALCATTFMAVEPGRDAALVALGGVGMTLAVPHASADAPAPATPSRAPPAG